MQNSGTTMSKIMYYDEHADMEVLKGKNIGIIGYGIQGRAQALNLRDSGVNIRVGNREDSYKVVAESDGFTVYNPKDLAEWSDVIMYLIPDDAQADHFESWIEPHLKEGNALVFAHGYSVYHKTINIPEGIDILLLAPRMPGKYIRERYLNDWGVPVFVEAHKDYSGNGLNIVLALAKGIGATRIGAMKISLSEETEIDLFIEQYVLPQITATIHEAFDFLVSENFTPEAVISELYASAEIGELIAFAAKSNIYHVFKDHASPTCQYGKMIGTKLARKGDLSMKEVLNNLRNGTFNIKLSNAAKEEYKELNEYYDDIENTKLVKTHKVYNDLHRLK